MRAYFFSASFGTFQTVLQPQNSRVHHRVVLSETVSVLLMNTCRPLMKYFGLCSFSSFWTGSSSPSPVTSLHINLYKFVKNWELFLWQCNLSQFLSSLMKYHILLLISIETRNTFTSYHRNGVGPFHLWLSLCVILGKMSSWTCPFTILCSASSQTAYQSWMHLKTFMDIPNCDVFHSNRFIICWAAPHHVHVPG